VPGLSYQVTFELAGNPDNLPTIKPMRVSADGQSMDFAFDITGRTRSNMGWNSQTWSFIADDTSTTLQFQSLTTFQGWGPVLDNVTVNAAVNAVPEPATAWLFCSALAGLLLVRWHKKKEHSLHDKL